MTARASLLIALAALPGLAAADLEPLRHDPFAVPAATRPSPPVIASVVEPPALVWRPKLSAVVVAGSRSMVSIDGRVVALGEQIDGYQLVQVEEQRAAFAKNGVRFELKMDGGNAATR